MIKKLPPKKTSFTILIWIITLIVSVVVLVLSMRSGINRTSFPPKLDELTTANVVGIRQIYLLENSTGITGLTYSKDGRYLADSRLDGTLHVWNTADYHLLYTFEIDANCQECFAFSPDNHTIAAVHVNRPYDLVLWDVETGKSPWESNDEPNGDEKITSLAFSPDGQTLADASSNSVTLWDMMDYQPWLIISIYSGTLQSLDFSPDGKRLLTTNADKTAQVWDIGSGASLMILNGHTSAVKKGIFSPAGAWIVTAGDDATIRIWESSTGHLIHTLAGHKASVTALAISPNGQLLASGGDDSAVILWDVNTGAMLRTLTDHRKSVVGLSFSPDGQVLASASLDGTLRLWGVVSSKK